MATQTELEAVNSFIDPDGILWAVPIDGRPHILVATPRGINPNFRNVVNSSLLMFRTLAQVDVGLGLIVAFAEERGIPELAGHVLTMQAATTVSLRCAIEGLQNIANGSEKSS